jgi:fumarylacetoacetase
VSLASWVPGADGSGFPAEHLPYGVFSEIEGGQPSGRLRRVGARIGDQVLDLSRLTRDGLVDGPFDQPSLDAFMAGGPQGWTAVRTRLIELVCDTDPDLQARVAPALVPLARTELHVPFTVADYVDFYSSIEHATNLGRLLRPGTEPLLPNWRHLPVAYHGRSGTVVVSGTPIVRPSGQRRLSGPGPGAGGSGSDGCEVVFGPTERLDIELEVGFVIGAGSAPSRPVSVYDAAAHVFGVVLVNDWSARDIQAWEYQPLGPFLGKSFATSIGAWVTPLDALASCRVPGPVQQPPPLPYLELSEPWGLDLDLGIELAPVGTSNGSDSQVISRTNFAGLYWRLPQQIAHLTANGAHLRTGDLLASGTVSGPTRGSEGSLIELTRNGAEPLQVAGVSRRFLEDGDEVVLRGRADVGEGVTITLAEVRGRILPAW